jgi:ribosomal protein S18 acetylase RimI-like enzyme
VAERGYEQCSLSVSVANSGARRLYERLGYRPVDRPPKRVVGTIQIRGLPNEVDDTIVFLTKSLASISLGDRSPLGR